VADRRNKTVRDMTISMVVIVIGVLVLVAFQGGFSFSPGTPSGGTAPTADVQGGFSTADRLTGFPVVIPKGLPSTWHGSSFSLTPAPGTPDAPPTVRGGWQTPTGSYITLIESSGSLTAVLAAELGQTDGSSTGSVTVGSAQWSISPGVRNEVAWSRTSSGVSLLITGNATVAEFTQLAAAVA
jgi:hypothetical protein